LGVQFAKALGFQVIAVDSRQAGRDLAMEMDNRSLQPDLVVDSSDPKTASERSIASRTTRVSRRLWSALTPLPPTDGLSNC